MTSPASPLGLFLHCRPGFEKECAAEIQERSAALGVSGYCRTRPHSAWVLFHPHAAEQTAALHARLPFDSLIFARQWFVCLTRLTELPVDDRVRPMAAALRDLPAAATDLFLETPDTNEGKQLSKLCRGLHKPLAQALALAPAQHPALRIHVCLLSGREALLGYARIDNSAAWPMGIPRLRLPASAPSRATLKLEEALLRFVDAQGAMPPGRQAVDLGAAPGGWSWQLVRRHQYVTAVDNGPMDPKLLETGQLEHVRADGFRFRPAQAVEWMVCDMVEQPIRIARLAARWLCEGWCRQTIFNLKLPMKQRYAEVRRCLDEIETGLQAAGLPYRLAAKQLYHDREEITVYARVLNGAASNPPH
jgi:23S rRNA (cytidine2498-2'-O)-methyltransferase